MIRLLIISGAILSLSVDAATGSQVESVVITAARQPGNIQNIPIPMVIMPVTVYSEDMAIRVAAKSCTHAQLPDGGHWSATLKDFIWDVRYLTKESKPECVPLRVRIFETTGSTDGCIACIPAR
jgi:hypothetical protein